MGRMSFIILAFLLFQTIGFGQVKLKDPLLVKERGGLCWNAMSQLNEESMLGREFFDDDKMWLDTFSLFLSEKVEKTGLILILSKSKKSFYYLKLIPQIVKYLEKEKSVKFDRLRIAFIKANTEKAFLKIIPNDKNTSETLEFAKYELSQQEVSKLLSVKSNKISPFKRKN